MALLSRTDVQEAIDRLSPHAVNSDARWFGRRFDAIGRAQSLVPPITVLQADERSIESRLCLTAFHEGRGCAHGGVVSLVFDEVLGGLANADGFSLGPPP